jgi:hypothetical protein
MSDITLMQDGGNATLKGSAGAAHVRASAMQSEAVVPHDNTAIVFHALRVGTGGTVVIKHTADGDPTTFLNVQDGETLPVSGVRVMAATDAEDIVALRW